MSLTRIVVAVMTVCSVVCQVTGKLVTFVLRLSLQPYSTRNLTLRVGRKCFRASNIIIKNHLDRRRGPLFPISYNILYYWTSSQAG